MKNNLANKDYIDEFTKEIFVQSFSNAIKKKTLAYNACVVGAEHESDFIYSGYYSNSLLYRKKDLGLNFINWNTTYVESRNAVKAKKEFNPR